MCNLIYIYIYFQIRHIRIASGSVHDESHGAHQSGHSNQSQTSDGCKQSMKLSKMFVCKVCGKEYKHIYSYRSHYKIHTDDCYKCEYCGKKFGRKSNYKEHVRIHTNEKPYKCKYCAKGFKQRHGYLIHALQIYTQYI